MVLKVKVSPDLIAGDVDEGYGKVADVFRRNLTSGEDPSTNHRPETDHHRIGHAEPTLQRRITAL